MEQFSVNGKTSYIIKITFFICSLLWLLSANAEVIPDFYRTSNIEQSRDTINQEQENIDPFTGVLQRQYVDFSVPGNGGFDLKIIRSYNSGQGDNVSDNSGSLGLGWSIHFGKVLINSTNTLCGSAFVSVLKNPVLETPDGNRQLLSYNTSNNLLTNQRWKGICRSGGGIDIYSPNGTRYEMTHYVSETKATAWYTKKIIDRNGNYADINYARAGSDEISSITTNDGRNLGFTYETVQGTNNRRIQRITDQRYNTYQYTYREIPNVVGKYWLESVIRPDSEKWVYEYNGDLGLTAGSYLLSKVTNPFGGISSYQYSKVNFSQSSAPYTDGSSVVAQKTTSTGGKWSYSYAPSNSGYDTTIITAPEGRITYKHIGANYVTSGSVWKIGLLVSKQIGSEQVESYTWSSQKISDQNYLRPGQFITKIDQDVYAPILIQKTISRSGATYKTDYSNFNSYGAAQTIIENGPSYTSRSTSISYYTNLSAWILNQVQDEKISTGNETNRTFDARGNLLSIRSNGVETRYSYDSEGNTVSKITPRGLTTTYSSYYRGISRGESQEEGVYISRSVDSTGNVTRITNGENKTTSYTYDSLNRIRTITPPIGNYTFISYNRNSMTSSRGSLTKNTYFNGFGKPIKISTGGVSVIYSYDELGRKIFESYPGSTNGINYQYDTLGRVTSIRNADGSYRYISYSSNTVNVRDERQYSTTYNYKSYGNPDEQLLIGVATPIVSTNITIKRNSRDLIESLSQDGITRSYYYNARNYLTSVIDPEIGGAIIYGRDDAGNMTSKSKSGTTITYQYDRRNRLYSIQFSNSSINLPVTLSYDKTDAIKSSNRGGVLRTYNYDSNHNLLDEGLTIDNLALKLSYTYDGNDNLATLTYPDPDPNIGKVWFYPDSLGRPTKVYPLADVGYHPNGIVKDIYFANGLYSLTSLNSRQWPDTITVAKAGSAILNTKYAYDYSGNIININDSVDSSYNRTLGYDGINRLTTSNGPWGSGIIAYDGKGNIKSQKYGAATLTYNYSSNNQLSSVSGARSFNFAYDAWGRIINNGRNNFSYDDSQNLSCIDCSLSSKTIFAYDTDNLRVKKTKGGISTYYFHNKRGQLMFEYTPAQGMAKQYAYVAGKQIAMRRLWSGTLDLDHDGISDRREVNGSTTSITPGEDLTYYHTDILGSPLAATTHPNGTLWWKESYKPYGEKWINNILGRNSNNVWFAGKVEDSESGLSYFGARYYDPILGRFMSPDPIEPDPNNIHSLNRYAYSNNNPHKYIDPDGQYPVTVFDNGSDVPNFFDLPGPPEPSSEGGFLNYFDNLDPIGGLQAWPAGVELVGIAGVLSKVGNITTTRVGRWMSQVEYDAMKLSGKVQESYSGTTHVANPADASAFIKQAKPGSLYIEFDIPSTSLKATNEGWSKIIGPNTLDARLATRKGLPVPQMPNATNITHSATKLP